MRDMQDCSVASLEGLDREMTLCQMRAIWTRHAQMCYLSKCHTGGIYRGKALCARGKRLVCKGCWLANSEAHEKPRWAAWFERREKRYPGAIPDDSDI